MCWSVREIRSGKYEYEYKQPEPLGFIETYILLGSVSAVLLLFVAIVFN